jgi:hypothetical protein
MIAQENLVLDSRQHSAKVSERSKLILKKEKIIMKISKYIIAIFLASMFSSSIAMASDWSDIQGRYEENNCILKMYNGNGTLKIIQQTVGWGYIYLKGGTDVVNVGKSENADVWNDGYGNIRIILHVGGYVDLSGKMEAFIVGKNTDVSSRGNYSVKNGPPLAGSCWEQWNELN